MELRSKRFLASIFCLASFLACTASTSRGEDVPVSKPTTIADVISKVYPAFSTLFLPKNNSTSLDVTGRQRVTVSNTGVTGSFGIRDFAGLFRAFLWTAVILIMTEAWVFPVFTLSYKDVFCDYFTGDCENRYGIPRFEPEVEQYFVVDKKKTISLNEKNVQSKQRPPFPLKDGYEKLDIFPPLKHRPEPALSFDEPILGPALPQSQRRIGFYTDEIIEQAKQEPPDSLNGMIMRAADWAYNFLNFSYKIFGWMFD